jgi:AcrR family transcriptional regulator
VSATAEPKAGRRRAELIALGIRLFSDHPYDELSMDQIAGEAGVVKGVLYYYFGSKRGYYVAAVQAAAAELRERWDVPAEEATPADRLAAGIDAYVDHAANRAAGYRTLMAGGVGSDPEVRAILDEERRLVIKRIVEALGMRKAPPALRTALEGWLSSMEGATLNWLDNRDLEAEQVRNILLGMLNGALTGAAAVDPRCKASFTGSDRVKQT